MSATKSSSKSEPKPDIYDVAILGSGLSGSVMATVLAKQGYSVLLIDAKEHPRFVLGESTVPRASALAAILGGLYDIPEIGYLASPDTIAKHVAPTSGLKRGFGFAYHHPGQKARISEAAMTVLLRRENHLYRQDTDQYMAKVAEHYGARLRENTWIESFDIDDEGVTLTSSEKETFRARFLVDGSGYSSPFCRQMLLRDLKPSYRLNTRCIFTHAKGVKPFEEILPPTAPDQEKGAKWSQSTLHHVFDGGWIWVIPFDNHEDTVNPYCSIGLNIDANRFPRPDDITAEQEFYQWVSQFPDIMEHFDGMEPVRDWVATGRLQYSTHDTVGDRYCLMAQTAGAIDALYSRGLSNTFEVVFELLPTLLSSLEKDQFSAANFAGVAALQKELWDYNDMLVDCSYTGFRHPSLWEAWRRIWEVGIKLEIDEMVPVYKDYIENQTDDSLLQIRNRRTRGFMVGDNLVYKQLFEDTARIIESVADNGDDPLVAAELVDDMRASTFPRYIYDGDIAEPSLERA